MQIREFLHKVKGMSLVAKSIIIPSFYNKRPLHNSSTIYKNNKMHLFCQKTRQITSYFPHFLTKYALFS
ncbi:MAG: hypothetical protein DRQ51_00950, partial [Gammaproteobacteria bacterium]